MRINPLPAWASLIVANGPYFGSEEDPAGGAVTDPPEVDPAKEAEAEKGKEGAPDNEEAVKAIRERDQLKAERDALAQEKQEREEAEAKAKAATLSKEENLEAQVQSLTEENQNLTRVNEANILKIAVLENSKYQWIDPADAITLLDRSGIKIDPKKGTAEGVEDALKSLAKTKPHLLKPTEDNEGNSGNGNGAGPAGPTRSGGTPSGNRDSSAAANKRQAMISRFGPVLAP